MDFIAGNAAWKELSMTETPTPDLTPPTIDQSAIERLSILLDSLDIRSDEQWYALIGKGYDLCVDSARRQPDHPNAATDAIVGRFACGAYAIRALPIIAECMNALPAILASISPSPIAGKEGVLAPLDDGMRTAARFAREVVQQYESGRHGLVHNLERLEAFLDQYPARACTACPPLGHPSDTTRCAPCPRRTPPAECVATPGEVGKLCERIGVYIEKAGFTCLSADEITDPDPDGVQEVGWRIHDMPEEPAHIAYWLAGGLEEYQAKIIVEAVNGLPTILTLLTQMEARIAAAERDETCPLCEGREMGPGEFCIATCRDGKVRWTTANVLRSMAPHLAGDRRRIEAQSARIAALERGLEPFASQHTVGETLMTCEAPPWTGLSPEQRLAMLAERKEAHDANILNARALLNPTPTEGGS
jgi:hypothetical protein